MESELGFRSALYWQESRRKRFGNKQKKGSFGWGWGAHGNRHYRNSQGTAIELKKILHFVIFLSLVLDSKCK